MDDVIERTVWLHRTCLEVVKPDAKIPICFPCTRQIGPKDMVEYLPAEQPRRAVDLLRDVANSAPEFEDPRMGYVVVQIDRPTWEELAPYRTGGQ